MKMFDLAKAKIVIMITITVINKGRHFKGKKTLIHSKKNTHNFAKSNIKCTQIEIATKNNRENLFMKRNDKLKKSNSWKRFSKKEERVTHADTAATVEGMDTGIVL